MPKENIPDNGGSPLPQSESYAGIRHTGHLRIYEEADTWYPTWAKNGRLYTPYADGHACGETIYCTWSPSTEKFFRNLGEGAPERPQDFEREVEAGHAIIDGEDPDHLKIQVLPKYTQISPRFHGSYPCGSLIYNGIWYYGQYFLHRWINDRGQDITYELGPFQGFRISRDYGQSWSDFPRDDRDPLFAEVGRCAGGAPIRFGAPHFIDFGRELEHSPDGFAYLCAHGTRDPEGVANWAAGDAIFLARFKPSPEAANNPEAYEFFGGLSDNGNPVWIKSLQKAEPIMEWPGHCGIVNMTYFPAIRKYIALMCVAPFDGAGGHYDTWVTIADNPWGPWKNLDYLSEFGSQAYFACIPSKFVSEDNLKFEMFYSANWYHGSREDPPGSEYALCIGEFELLAK